ncbi:MAG: HIT family protein [Promethearchaeota archaeon]
MNPKDCIFCKIKNGELHSFKVYEDESVLAFLDLFPFNKGHTVVIPKEHCNNFLVFNDKNIQHFFTVLKKIAINLKNNLKAQGINILSNNFSVAGQVVEHMHFHIIPRWKNDGIPQLGKKKRRATMEELQEILSNFFNK